MGRKVHPIGFRLGTIKDWQAKWYADKNYSDFILEDAKIRKAIRSKYADASISLIEIERQANRVSINIHTARPGIVIGRGGQRVDETRHLLEDLIGKKIQLNIQEIRQPEMDAYLVARSVADQMERRIAYRRAMKQSIFRTIQAGAQGMRIVCSGRLGGAEIARRQLMHQGRVPLHTIRADIDYGFAEASTTMGLIGVKVWIYRGDILPEVKETVIEGALVEPAAEVMAEMSIVEKVKTAPVKEVEKETALKPVKSVDKKTIAEKEEKAVTKEADVEAEDKETKPKVKKTAKKNVEEVAEKKAAKEEADLGKEPKKAKPAAKKAAEEKEDTSEAKKTAKKKPVAKKEDTETPAEPAENIEE